MFRSSCYYCSTCLGTFQFRLDLGLQNISLLAVSMFDYLFLPTPTIRMSHSSSSSTASPKKPSLSSSRPDFRPIHSEIVRRTLLTNFLEATSLPVNVPIHRSREASRPSTPMREEFYRSDKQLPLSLANKLLASPGFEDKVEKENMFKREVEGGVEKGVRTNPVRNDNLTDLIFTIDL